MKNRNSRWTKNKTNNKLEKTQLGLTLTELHEMIPKVSNHSLKLWKFTLPQVVYMLGVHWKPQELNGGCANIPLVLVGNNFLYSIVTGDKTCVLQQVCLKANNSWCNVSYTLSSHKEIQNIKLYQKNKSWQVFWDPKGYTFGWFLPQGTTTTT